MNTLNRTILSIIAVFICILSYAHGSNNYEHSDFIKGVKPGDKAALVMVHFGTTHEDTRAKTIDALNERVKDKYPEFDFYEAYTSRIIIKRLGDRGIVKNNPEQLLNELLKQGYTHVLLQPTKIIDGVEMESLNKNVAAKAEQFKDIRVGNPLLYEPEDYEKVVAVLTRNLDPNKAYLLVGHGTYDPTTAQYAMMDYMFKAKGHKNCIVGTIEGYPTFKNALDQLKHLKTREVTLIPFMFVAGDHAKNDIAGEWKEELEKEGYNVNTLLQGLGENCKIQDIYLDHIEFMLHHKKRDILAKKALYEVTGQVME